MMRQTQAILIKWTFKGRKKKEALKADEMEKSKNELIN